MQIRESAGRNAFSLGHAYVNQSAIDNQQSAITRFSSNDSPPVASLDLFDLLLVHAE
jgi:hypothetical protein